jgi:hypothetical protein
MSVLVLVQRAPAPVASGLPGSGSTTPGAADSGGAGQSEVSGWLPPSEAVLITSVLAGWCSSLLTLSTLTLDQAEHLLSEVMGQQHRSHREVLAWATRVEPCERRSRWNAAVATATRLYSQYFDMSGVAPVAHLLPAPAEPADDAALAMN